MRNNKQCVAELKKRMKSFAIKVINLVKEIPYNKVAEVITKQLLRSGTSVGANYLAACRARSRADFISKMTIVEEEIDESIYWIELLTECNIIELQDVRSLIKEANELLSIIVSSIVTAKQHA